METVEWAVVAALVILGATLAFETLGTTVITRIEELSASING